MNGAKSRLPAGFETLEPFVDAWALSSAAERAQMRLDQGGAGCAAFYAAAHDLLAPALAHLDKKSLAEFDEAEKRLMKLFLGFAHAALAVEVQRDDEAKHAADARFVRITRAPADIDG
jgi:hypothetical protein